MVGRCRGDNGFELALLGIMGLEPIYESWDRAWANGNHLADLNVLISPLATSDAHTFASLWIFDPS